MRVIGQLSLLCAFVASGYAAFACIAGWKYQRKSLVQAGKITAGIALLSLSVVIVVLAYALVTKDFTYQYVQQYSSTLLPWHYALSALWVGQAGSLLIWAWFLGLLAFGFLFVNRGNSTGLHLPAFGFLLANVCFLTATMVFAADPMEGNIAPGQEGVGLSPLLQHPAMLIHPPIVFLGYAAWAIPCALALSTLFAGRRYTTTPASTTDETSSISVDWVKLARPWALFAWAVLGSGILLGAEWSYEELGWGGYWGWDPVENGSLIPWLTGTAFLHGLMAWQFRGILKKSTLALALATFGLCNFATFLTRSGIFSSLHAFSQSPIGWLFLALQGVVFAVGGWLMIRHRHGLQADTSITSLWSRESCAVIASASLLMLALVTLLGTLSVALSEALIGKRIVVGAAFYNYVSIPVGLVTLATVGLAPLLRWGRPPTPAQRRLLRLSGVAAVAFVALGFFSGIRHPLGLAVAGLAAFALAALIACLVHDAKRISPNRPWNAVFTTLIAKRRQYAGFLIHVGFACVIVGVAGSSLGTQQTEAVIAPGETIDWAGYSIRFVKLNQETKPDIFVSAAELEVASAGGSTFRLLPAQHLHRLQNQWTTEVDIHSDWSGDLYTILHSGEEGGAVRVTLVKNPLMRFLWLGGCITAFGSVLALWPQRSQNRKQSAGSLTRQANISLRHHRRPSTKRNQKAELTS